LEAVLTHPGADVAAQLPLLTLRFEIPALMPVFPLSEKNPIPLTARMGKLPASTHTFRIP